MVGGSCEWGKGMKLKGWSVVIEELRRQPWKCNSKAMETNSNQSFFSTKHPLGLRFPSLCILSMLG